MLGRRVATALALLAILLPAIFVFPAPVWGVVTLAFLAVAAWEWTRLLPGSPPPAVAAAVLTAAGVGVLAWRGQAELPSAPLLILQVLLAGFWLLAGPLRLRGHEARRGGWLLAAVLLFGCWLALYELRVRGAVPLLSSMAVIWVADIGAYFVGRAVGRRKLAPSISPGKSWEGAIGGALAVAAIGLGASAVPQLDASLPSLLVHTLGTAAAVAVLLAIAALSVVGDLHESLLKREAGVKDSGRLLPGHGGVLDRIDALIPTMPAALLLYLLLG